VEGKYYVWSRTEVEQILGTELAELVCSVYDVSVEGNWEEQNILNRSKTYAQSAKLFGVGETELREKLTLGKRQLLEVRSRRVRPGLDDKILTAWNGLMIAAFAQAAQVLDDQYLAPATKAAEFLAQKMRGSDGRLLRTYRTGSPAKLNAYLEDYAFAIDALVSLYEASFEVRWIQLALDLADVMVQQFWDDAQGGFFYVGRDHETLIVRNKDLHDGSTPSGNSMAVMALLRLAKLTGRQDLEVKAVQTLQLFGDVMARAPTAAAQMLVALDFYLGPVKEFAVVGARSDPQTQEVLQLIQGSFRPNKVVAWREGNAGGDEVRQWDQWLPLLANKPAQGGKVTTYVCENFTCQAPLVGATALKEKLAAGEVG
jgi:hypothetical protein